MLTKESWAAWVKENDITNKTLEAVDMMELNRWYVTVDGYVEELAPLESIGVLERGVNPLPNRGPKWRKIIDISALNGENT
jgi:hypothetical protein